MNRFRAALSGVILAAVFAGPALSNGFPVTARDSVVVADEVVRLGDLFQNVGDKGGEAVAPAPGPGDRAVFETEQLTAIARAKGIEWQPRGRIERVLVERASRVLDGSQVQRELARAIADKAPGRDVEVELEGRLAPIHLPLSGASRVRFADIILDGERVSATLVVPTGEGRESRSVVTGRTFPVIDVPVLAKPVMPGEEIRADDLEWTKVRAGRLRQGLATETRQIVGRVSRRPLTPGVPIVARDLQERVVVSKNSLVTVVLQTHNMTLTTRGKALEDGADGATVRVLTSSGDRTIEASVVGPDLVQVRPAQSIAAALGRKK